MQYLSISLPCARPALMQAFYQKLLKQALLANDEGSWKIKAGFSTLHFFHSEPHPPLHFAFLVTESAFYTSRDYVESITPLLPFDANGSIAFFQTWNAHAFYFHDPDGNIVEFITRHEWVPCQQGSNEYAEVISLNEFGIVTTNPTLSVSKLQLQTGLKQYDKGPCSEDFCAIGNEAGLLLVSAVDRGWWPTGEAAKPVDYRVFIEVNNKTFEISTLDFQ